MADKKIKSPNGSPKPATGPSRPNMRPSQAGGASIGWAPGLTSGFRWQTLDANGKPNDGSLKIYADVFWPQKGVTFDNVFGTNGNIMLSGAAKFTTQYWLGMKYDFGL